MRVVYLLVGCSRHPATVTCCAFCFQAEDGIRDLTVTGVQTCALPISDYGPRNCRERAGAVEYHSSRRLRQEFPGAALRIAGFDGVSDSLAEAAPMMPMLRAEIGRASCRERV